MSFSVSFESSIVLALFYPPEKERAANPDFEFVRDYAALNRASLEAGITQSKGLQRYRSHLPSFFFLDERTFSRSNRSLHDIKKKVFIRDVLPSKQPLKFDNDQIFGMPPRFSIDFFDSVRNVIVLDLRHRSTKF